MQQHWPPRKGEPVYDSNRMQDKEYPHGHIIAVIRDHEDEESSSVRVKFEDLTPKHLRQGRFVLAYDGDIFWDGTNLLHEQKIRTGKIEYIWIGEEETFVSEPEIQTYYFYELEGNWDSSDGGMGRWEL